MNNKCTHGPRAITYDSFLTLLPYPGGVLVDIIGSDLRFRSFYGEKLAKKNPQFSIQTLTTQREAEEVSTTNE